MSHEAGHIPPSPDQVLDQFTNKLAELGTKVMDNAGPASAQAWEIAKAAIRLDAFTILLVGGAWLIIGSILCFTAVRAYRRFMIISKETNGKGNDSSTTPFVTTIICGVLGGVSYLISLFWILDRIAWVSVISPEAGIALRLLHKVI